MPPAHCGNGSAQAPARTRARASDPLVPSLGQVNCCPQAPWARCKRDRARGQGPHEPHEHHPKTLKGQQFLTLRPILLLVTRYLFSSGVFPGSLEPGRTQLANGLCMCGPLLKKQTSGQKSLDEACNETCKRHKNITGCQHDKQCVWSVHLGHC